MDDQLRDGLHVLVDDGYFKAECVLELDNGEWYASVVTGTGPWKTGRWKGERSRG